MEQPQQPQNKAILETDLKETRVEIAQVEKQIAEDKAELASRGLNPDGSKITTLRQRIWDKLTSKPVRMATVITAAGLGALAVGDLGFKGKVKSTQDELQDLYNARRTKARTLINPAPKMPTPPVEASKTTTAKVESTPIKPFLADVETFKFSAIPKSPERIAVEAAIEKAKAETVTETKSAPEAEKAPAKPAAKTEEEILAEIKARYRRGEPITDEEASLVRQDTINNGRVREAGKTIRIGNPNVGIQTRDPREGLRNVFQVDGEIVEDLGGPTTQNRPQSKNPNQRKPERDEL